MRLALYILRQPPEYAMALSQTLVDAVTKMHFCSSCFVLTEKDPCSICTDAKRDSHVVCVVEDTPDLMAVERSRCYHGRYHVLQGALSPLDGIGPEKLRMAELVKRIGSEKIREVILATSNDVTGQATALYLSKLIKPLGVKLTKLAEGIPAGSDIEYVDYMTLARALESRVEF